jgi:hypothetical protein
LGLPESSKYPASANSVIEEQSPFDEAVAKLIAAMRPEYAEIVKRDLRTKVSGVNNLTFATWQYARRHLKYGSPLELPDEVATMFFTEQDLLPDESFCEECRYALPRGRQCPFCGGNVFSETEYFMRADWIKQYGSSVPLPPEYQGEDPSRDCPERILRILDDDF